MIIPEVPSGGKQWFRASPQRSVQPIRRPPEGFGLAGLRHVQPVKLIRAFIQRLKRVRRAVGNQVVDLFIQIIIAQVSGSELVTIMIWR